MTRPIDANALKSAIDNGWKPDMMVSEIWDIIDEQPIVDAVPVVRCKDCAHCEIWEHPTADAVPVKHGHWEIKKVWSPAFSPIERPFCSLCGGRGSTSALYGYCPYCGAKMDEVSE